MDGTVSDLLFGSFLRGPRRRGTVALAIGTAPDGMIRV